MKTCNRCGEDKDKFYADKRTRDGLSTICADCTSAYLVAWKTRNRDRVLAYNRTHYRRSNYRIRRKGLTLDEYEALYESQGGVCAICERPETIVVRGQLRPLHIDHDESSGKVRGLLCSACNTGIGKLGHDAARMGRAAEYVARFEQALLRTAC